MGVVRFGPNITVNTTTEGLQNLDDVAKLADGRLVVVWTDGWDGPDQPGGDGDGEGVRGRLFSADGEPIGEDFLVNSHTQGNQAGARVSALSDGGFVVVWTDGGGAGGDASGRSVTAQIFTSEGVKAGQEILVNEAVAGQQWLPEVTALANGAFVVIWADASEGVGGAPGDNSLEAIKGRLFEADGYPLGSEFRVNTTTLNSQTMPVVTALSGGGFAVSWMDESQTGGDTVGSAVRAQVYDPAAAPAGAELLLNSQTVGTQGWPELYGLPFGGFVAIWTDRDEAGDGSLSSVKAQVVAADGQKVGGEILVNTATAGSQDAARAVTLPGGGFVVTWHDSSQGVGGAEGDTDGYAIKAQIFDDSGMKVGPEILVNTTTSGYQVTPNIAVTSSGGFAIGWMDYDVASSTAAVTQMFAADGTRIGGETRLSVSAQVSEFNLTLIGLVDDRVFVAWPSDSDVAAQLMGIAPVVTGVEAPTDGTHAFGAELAFTVTFDEDVTVAGGTPRLAIDIGGVTRYATYVSGSPGTTLTFKYTVAGGDTDTDGIEIVGLEANGATLMSAGDHPALLTLHGLPATGAILVRGDQPPVIDGLTGNAEFVEGLNEPSEAVVVAADITVTDGDSESLASATVSITGTFRAGEDKLDFVNGPGMGDIQGAYNAATGVLTLTSAGGATPAEFQAALRAVTYINTSETPYSADRTLTFQVSDGAATSLAATRTLKVVEMDDTPSGADKALSMNEDSDHVFGAGDFGFSDTDGGTLRGVTLTTLPNVGAITLDGAAVTAGQVVTRADIDAGKLAFRGPLNGAGDDLASFTFQVMDDLGEDYTGQAVDQSPNTITFSLTAVSDAPSGIDATVTAGQDASRALTVADFGFSDVDGDTLAAVKIIALPAHGALTLNAVAVTANQTIPAADIAAGKLVFVPQAGQFGAAYATITFQVQDTGSTTNGGENLDLSFNTLTLDVTEAPPEPPPTTPATPTVDGVPVTTTPGTSPSGTPTQTVTVPVVQPGRTDSVGGNNVADIPIVTESGATLLSVQAPAGYGLTASGPAEPKTAGTSLTDLIREIQAHTSSGSTDQTLLTGGGSGFLGALTTSTPLLVQTVVPTGGGAGAAPLVINGTAATGDAMTALVIDTRGLPSGSTLQLNNVDFAAVVGAVTVTGGAGSQIVYGDGASQTLFLGADDDELHGGGGTDTVASAAGADRLYGDDGSDSVSGGIGDDVVHGNAGADTVSGGEGADRAYGGKDNDRVTGDGGHDLIFGDLGDDFLQGNAGTDSLDGGAGNDTVHGGQDNDQVTGGDGNDAVLGDAGDDAIQGGLGNDTATGGIGADLIHGGQGNDILYGEAGTDWLSGDRGSDTLSGGSGADVFHANAQTGLDWVTDFSFAEGDRVLLDLGTTYSVSQGSSGVVIDIAGGAQMVLAGVQLSALQDGWIGLG